jgi:hypothetical protein
MHALGLLYQRLGCGDTKRDEKLKRDVEVVKLGPSAEPRERGSHDQ